MKAGTDVSEPTDRPRDQQEAVDFTRTAACGATVAGLPGEPCAAADDFASELHRPNPREIGGIRARTRES